MASIPHRIIPECGYAFVAEREAHRACMTCQASYLTHQSATRDPIDWNPEFSRRARGFATYASLRELGSLGVCNWQTSHEDVMRTVAAVERVSAKMRQDSQAEKPKELTLL